MKRIILLAGCLVATQAAFSAQMVPARFVSVATNIVAPSNTAEEVFENLNLRVVSNTVSITSKQTNLAGTVSNLLARALFESNRVNGIIGLVNTQLLRTATSVVAIAEASAGGATITNGVMRLKAPSMLGWIEGVHATYDSPTSVKIGIGAGYCMNRLFRNDAEATVTISKFPAAAGFTYVYLDHSASTYPATLAFTNSLTEPAFVSATNQIGWYNGQDRCVAAVYASATAVFTFGQQDGRYTHGTQRVLCSSGNPKGYWMSTTTNTVGYAVPTYEASVFLPKNAKDALILVRSLNNGAGAAAWETIQAVGRTAAPGGAAIFADAGGNGWANPFGWIPLGDSRKVGVYGHASGGDSYFECRLLGWTINR